MTHVARIAVLVHGLRVPAPGQGFRKPPSSSVNQVLSNQKGHRNKPSKIIACQRSFSDFPGVSWLLSARVRETSERTRSYLILLN